MTSIWQVFGGLGLFLLGMSLMTQGLKALAGSSLRRALAHFTKSPTSGAVTGAIATAIIQSSSITVVTAVGFVGAQLLTFPQALGVIYGANIGTTVTGWIVTLVGFKFSLDQAMLPLIFLGSLLHLFGRSRWAKIGFAIAGFGLIFVGIGMLQEGMAAAEQFVSPQTFPEDTPVGRIQLLLMGCAITVVTQSSSAGVATALAAVSAGTISFPQAAALVIGMDVGTTVTAVLATIGGNTAVRRTGLSHVVYNVLTAVVALATLTPYVWTITSLFPGALSTEPELCLVGFHSAFNLLGVTLVLPFAGRFAALIERACPEDKSSLVRHLGSRLEGDDLLSLGAAHSALTDIAKRAFEVLEVLLRHGDDQPLRRGLDELTAALAHVSSFLSTVQTTRDTGGINEAHLAVLHALDHLRSLLELCGHPPRAATHRDLKKVSIAAAEGLLQARKSLERKETATRLPHPSALDALEAIARSARHEVLERTASGAFTVAKSLAEVEATQWTATVGEHAARVLVHLNRFAKDGALPTPSPQPAWEPAG